MKVKTADLTGQALHFVYSRFDEMSPRVRFCHRTLNLAGAEAAMREEIAENMGDEVEIPDELCGVSDEG